MRVIKYASLLNEDGGIYITKKSSRNFKCTYTELDTPTKIFDFATNFLHLDKKTEEYVYMLCFNTKMKLIGIFEISHGAVDYTVFNTREIFQKALLANSVNIVLLHNHPSGDPTPSTDDRDATNEVRRAGDILGIRLVDHIVIGGKCYSRID